MKRYSCMSILWALLLLPAASLAQVGGPGTVVVGGGSSATGTIGGSTGATDNAALCADGVGGATLQACTQALFPLGSVAAPGISFDGDPNTGIYSTADELYFATAGARRLTITSGSVVLGYGIHLVGGGTQHIGGYLVQLYARTQGSGAPLAMPSSASSQWSTNEGATAEVYVSLPAAETGLHFSACVQDADGFRYTAASGDTIRVIDKVTAAAGYISSTTIGSCVTLTALNATEWFATDINGVWTDGTWSYDDTSLTTP